MIDEKYRRNPENITDFLKVEGSKTLVAGNIYQTSQGNTSIQSNGDTEVNSNGFSVVNGGSNVLING